MDIKNKKGLKMKKMNFRIIFLKKLHLRNDNNEILHFFFQLFFKIKVALFVLLVKITNS